ncbi:MAG: universal stress protein [Desulfurococcales archaeon]|nr:universal stress protein [Desulfurococcales archaeon]
MFENVAVLAVKSQRLLAIAYLAARLFPSATYHIISTIPENLARPTLLTLYKRVMEEIAEDSINGVEMSLYRANLLAVKKVILKGRPEKVILDYIKKRKIDLTVMTAGVTDAHAFQLSGAVSRTMIAEAPSNLLIYPSAAKDIPERMDTLLIVVPKEILAKRGLVEDIVKRVKKVEGIKRATVLCKVKEERCRDSVVTLKELVRDVEVHEVLDETNFFEKYGELSAQADFVIAWRGKSELSRFSLMGRTIERKRPSLYQITLLELSRSPLLLL